jgi:hypothetical protein
MIKMLFNVLAYYSTTVLQYYSTTVLQYYSTTVYSIHYNILNLRRKVDGTDVTVGLNVVGEPVGLNDGSVLD